VLLHNDEFAVAKPTALDNFFSDSTVLELLAHPFKAFSAPNQQTKSAFETRTSAINVTPSSNTRYDIKEVKEDALWLSKEARIDEVSALRIVIVECQDRPSAQLLGRLSKEEVLSIQEAARINQASTVLLSGNANSGPIEDDFDSQESRRLRILRTHLSERRNIIQCLNIVCQRFFYHGSGAQGNGKGKETAEPVSWLLGVGQNILQKIGDQDKWIVEALSAIRVTAGNIDGGSGWFQANGGREDIEWDWIKTQIMEIAHTMEVIFQIVDVHPTLCSSTIVVAWLEAMEQYGFFDQFPTVRRLSSPQNLNQA
jgi:nuclear pore complex protein Nup188